MGAIDCFSMVRKLKNLIRACVEISIGQIAIRRTEEARSFSTSELSAERNNH
jgi:hypothetical protein